MLEAAAHLLTPVCTVQTFCIINNIGTTLQSQTKWDVTTDYSDWYSHSQPHESTLSWTDSKPIFVLAQKKKHKEKKSLIMEERP